MNWRFFATIPIGLFGVRALASPSELTRSSDNRNVQFTNLSAGLLVGAEPWDYRFGRNRCPVPLRVLGGFHIVDPLNDDRRGLATLLGVMATLPSISTGIDVPDLSNIGIGAFWEVDMREEHPFLSGNHFLLTATVNLLTVGTQASGKK